MVRRSGAEREGDGAISQVIQPHAFHYRWCQGPAGLTASSACASSFDTRGPGCDTQLWLGPRPNLSFESKGRAKLAGADKAAGAHREPDRTEPARSRWPCRTVKAVSEMQRHVLPQIPHRCGHRAVQGASPWLLVVAVSTSRGSGKA